MRVTDRVKVRRKNEMRECIDSKIWERWCAHYIYIYVPLYTHDVIRHRGDTFTYTSRLLVWRHCIVRRASIVVTIVSLCYYSKTIVRHNETDGGEDEWNGWFAFLAILAQVYIVLIHVPSVSVCVAVHIYIFLLFVRIYRHPLYNNVRIHVLADLTKIFFFSISINVTACNFFHGTFFLNKF